MSTIELSKCSLIAMTSGGEKTHPLVIHNGFLQEWIGIGWIELREATEEDSLLYPTTI